MSEEVKSTTNYDLFDPYEVNRNVNTNSKKFRELVKSMREHGFIPAYPLHCVPNGNGQLKVKAGHHRLRAAMQLNIPVKYVVSRDEASIHELETAGPGKWKLSDFFISFCKQGLPNYLELQEYMERTGISLNNAASMFYGQLAGSGNFAKEGKFEEGNFEIRDRKHPAIVGDIVIYLQQLGIDWANKSGMVMALSRAAKVKSFDPERFKQKANTYKQLFEKQKNLQAYLDMIERVYNYQSSRKHKIPLAFYAQEAAKESLRRCFPNTK